MVTRNNSYPVLTKIYSIIIALLPILAITKYNISGIYLDRLCLVLFSLITPFVSIKRGTILVDFKRTAIIIAYCLVVTANAFMYGTCGAFGIVSIWLIIFIGLSQTIYTFGDFYIIKKVLLTVSAIAALVVIVQSIMFYGLGQYWTPIPKSIYNPAIIEKYSTFLSSSIDLANGMFRPCGIFLEPAHMAEYCIIGLAISLFEDNKNNIISILISIGIIFTTSGIGIALVVCVWIYKAIRDRKSGNSILRLHTIVILGVAVVGIIIVLNQIGVADILKYRFTFGNSGTGFSSRFSSVSQAFKGFGFFQCLFGVGFDKTNPMWLSGLFSVIWQIGLVGLVLQLLVVFIHFSCTNKLGKCIIWIYLGLFLAAEVSNMTNITFYLGIVIASMMNSMKEIDG